jgi:adenylate kinase
MSLPKSSNTPIEKALETLTISRQHHLQHLKTLRLSPSGKIVVLNGLPGTGKLTILKRLKELLPEFTTCLLDNHLLIDPVTAVIPNRTDRHHELRRLVRAPIFEELSNQARKGHTILMTACLAAGLPIDEAFYQEHLDISRSSDTTIYWINVECRRDIHEQRVSTPERQQDSKTKLTDKHLLRLIMDTHKLIEPDVVSRGDTGLKLAFEKLDVSGSVEDSVGCLLDIMVRSSM